jgi:hypothetical protein
VKPDDFVADLVGCQHKVEQGFTFTGMNSAGFFVAMSGTDTSLHSAVVAKGRTVGETRLSVPSVTWSCRRCR